MALIDFGTLLIKNGELVAKETTGAGLDIDIFFGDFCINFWKDYLSISSREFTEEYKKESEKYIEKVRDIEKKYKIGSNEYNENIRELSKEYNNTVNYLSQTLEEYLIYGNKSRSFNLNDLTRVQSIVRMKPKKSNGIFEKFTFEKTLYMKFSPQPFRFNGLDFIVKRLNSPSPIYAVSFTKDNNKYVVIQGADVSHNFYRDKNNAKAVFKYLNNKVLSKENKLEKGVFSFE